MEFSRRGPATDGVADGHRCPDPPPHGDAMLVMRDALLWQLHKDRLRQEIIVGELAKIERTVALRAASGHHTTAMPRDSMPQPRGPVFGWEHYGDVSEENDVKLPPNNDRETAESRFPKPVGEDRANKSCNTCKCGGNAGPQSSAFDDPKLQDPVQTVPPSKTSPAVKWELTGITIPVKKPKPKLPMTWSCTVCQVLVNIEKVVQKHCAGRMHQSNIATLESRIKAISGQKAKKGAKPSTGTDEIKTSSIRWSCSTCQANGLCQSDLEEHLKGTEHQHNIVASCKEGSNNDMVKNIAPDEAKSHKSNVPQHAEKAHSVGCSTCQVICGRESDLQIHLKGKRHLNKIRAVLEESKNVAALCQEGSNNDVAKNIAPHEAKSHESNVSQHAEKPPLVACDICQVICGRESDLEIHLKGKRHLNKIRVLLEESKNITMDPEAHKTDLNQDSAPQHMEKTNCELDLESHLRDERLQLNIQALGEKTKQEKSNPQEIAKGRIPSSEWDCATCNSKAQFEHHCTNRRDQRKINVILGEDDIAKVSSLHIEVPCKEGSNNDMVRNIVSREAKAHQSNVPEHAEKPPSVWSCSTYQGICNCESDLDIHLMSKRIQDIVKECRNIAMNSESQNTKVNPTSVPQHVEETNCQLNWEGHPDLRDERLQPMNDRALRETINQDKNNPAEIAKDQIPSSEWDCAMCEVKCNSKAHFEHHCTGRKHQQKINMTLGEGDIAKVSSLHIKVPCKEGSNNDMIKNIVSQEAKSNQSNVPEHAGKPPLVGCSICQVMCGRELDLVIHLNGKKHIKKIRALLEESKNKAMNSEPQKANMNPDSVPQPAEITNCELDWESHLTEERHHLMNDWTLHEKISQDPPELVNDQIPSSEWDCAVCQAKCNSRAQFENHCLSKKHQRKTQMILSKSDIAKTGCLEALDELPSDGSNSKNELPSDGSNRENEQPSPNMEEQKASNFCGRMLEHHCIGGSPEQSSMQRTGMCSCIQVYGC
ncbi:uncharacterized protein LOC124654895 isoform X1 [Lolium rigidum]|uniref:uncharacterized protein LOC124654895 isoform X1 n=1 Tax=Lolium rigidum TaxID=89674 RepID=UPI001F5CB6A8|nr:uncharacterized protein LOC124654895 isoform X1 [Lolium rigidum]